MTLERCVVDRCQPLAELAPGPDFDPRRQQAEHVIEHLDLFVAEALGVLQEEIGYLPQRPDPFCRRTVRDRVFEFDDDRMRWLLHHAGQPVGPGLSFARNIDDRHLTRALSWNSVELQVHCTQNGRINAPLPVT
jgi:hypothetical protein